LDRAMFLAPSCPRVVKATPLFFRRTFGPRRAGAGGWIGGAELAVSAWLAWGRAVLADCRL